MAEPLVSLLMGSDSDLPTVKEACAVLQKFGVPFDVRVLSAHRCPEDLVRWLPAHLGALDVCDPASEFGVPRLFRTRVHLTVQRPKEVMGQLRPLPAGERVELGFEVFEVLGHSRLPFSRR